MRRSGPPAWFVTLIAIALVFGAYYLYVGFLGFMERGGMTPEQATQNALQRATQERQILIERRTPTVTPRPSSTPMPPCQPYLVRPDNVNVRRQASELAAVVNILPRNTLVCVLALEGEWYRIDADPVTRRYEEGFIRSDLLVPQSPSPTNTGTFVPPPTITLTPSHTPTRTPTPTATSTATRRPTRTPVPTPTPRGEATSTPAG